MVGLWGAARTIHQVAGFPGFFQGLTPRVLYQAPSTAVSWSVYEFFKAYLKSKNGVGGTDYDTISDLALPKVRVAAEDRQAPHMMVPLEARSE